VDSSGRDGKEPAATSRASMVIGLDFCHSGTMRQI
jgi:hypothetical protein